MVRSRLRMTSVRQILWLQMQARGGVTSGGVFKQAPPTQ